MAIGKKMAAASISRMSSSYLVDIKNLCFHRDWQVILHNFSLQILPQELVLLKGRNGSGKTTLLKILAGLLQPLEGTIHMARTYTYLGHQNGIKPYLTLNQFYKSLATCELQNSFITVTDDLKLTTYLDIPFFELSAGLKRRFALVQLLTPKVDLYIIDEPLEHLDNETAEIVWNMFQRIVEKGSSLLMTHHGVIPPGISLREVDLDVQL